MAPSFRPYNPSIGAPSGVHTPGLVSSVPSLSRVNSLLPRLHTPLLSHLRTRSRSKSEWWICTLPSRTQSFPALRPSITRRRTRYPRLTLGPFSEALYPAPPPRDLPAHQHASPPSPSTKANSTSPQPNILQLHLRIEYQSDMHATCRQRIAADRLRLPRTGTDDNVSADQTVRYIIGLVLEGELVLAYEGGSSSKQRQRVHACFWTSCRCMGVVLCLLLLLFLFSTSGEDGSEVEEGEGSRRPRSRTNKLPPNPSSTPTNSRFAASTPSNRSPVGMRLLPSIMLETEIGQEDKHVLRNVARVERFVQDVMRKTVEEQLVYPNFVILVLPDPDPEPQSASKDGAV